MPDETQTARRGGGGGKIAIILGALCVLTMLVPVVARMFNPCFIPWDRGCKEIRFQPHVAEYVALAGLPQASGPVHIAGRFAVVDAGEEIRYGQEVHLPKRLSPAHFEPVLTGEADQPDEVRTVILLNWGKELAGQFERSGYAGYVPTCEVILIDRASRTVIGREVFRGEAPEFRVISPNAEDRVSGVFGRPPLRAIVSYIQNLPRW